MEKSPKEKWLKNKMAPSLYPWLFFCIKCIVEHALKLKRVQGAEPPGRGLKAECSDGGGGGQPPEL